ncbi:MAG: glucose-6-phosphate dehydrogenase [Alphaproteobacteria bacterium]
MAASRRSDSPSPSDGLVIFGGTGDLALRMLYPSLYYLDLENFLPDDFIIIGAARGAQTRDAFVEMVQEAVRNHAGNSFDDGVWSGFQNRLRYCQVDAGDRQTFESLKRCVGDRRGIAYYLSTSPTLFGPICDNLAQTDMINGTNRVIVEKPLGRNLITSRATNDTIARVFPEHRVFRIDHYLGKETVQNLIALRFANRLFEPIWNSVNIAYVQITVAETVGVENRWSYYNEFGALRDMMQNHLLQLLCLVAMEPPSALDGDALRSEKIKTLRSLRPIEGAAIQTSTARGQYAAGIVGGKSVPGYTEETGGEVSDTETFAALRVDIDNWRWAGTPFYLRTGKRMADRRTDIIIQFRDVPHSAFTADQVMANRLVLTLQPKEEVSLQIMNKMPGISEGPMRLKRLPLSLSLSEAFKAERPRQRIAYERLLLDAIHGKTQHFVHRDETEAAWGFIDGIIEGWSRTSMAVQPYSAGSWGPGGSTALVERNGHHWND